MVIAATLTSDFLSAMDLTAISTALPTIVEDLGGSDFIWPGSAYTLAGVALVPVTGGLVSIFGRKPILLFCIACFALGSALAGAAQSLNMLIAARAIQGFASGGCIATTEIIYADLVPLPQRGIIFGIVAVMWAVASAIGPTTGGALANSGAWRWLFYLNLPVSGIALVLVSVFLKVRAPKSTFSEKMRRIDWIGSIVVVGGSASLTLGLTWGGVQFAWSSYQTLLPLIIGCCALFAFPFIEKYWSTEPTIPWDVVSNRTSLSGYLGTLIHSVVAFCAIYYLPVYFQAVLGASPIRSGIDLLGLAMFITPSSMVCGATVQIFRRYRPQNVLGWVLIIVGFGILTLLDRESDTARYIGCQIVLGIGLGIIWVATAFPILAPLPYSNNAHALAFYAFNRNLSQTWGIAIGGAVLQNQLTKQLPIQYRSTLAQGTSIAYAAIPLLPTIPEPLQTEVRDAFARSLVVLWEVMIGISGLGLLTVLLMKEIEMRTAVDQQWGLEKEKGSGDAENSVADS
ncbi:iron permease [Peniophora sp. CONT]|nr:iron permease [Peniophora sp. CONT]